MQSKRTYIVVYYAWRTVLGCSLLTDLVLAECCLMVTYLWYRILCIVLISRLYFLYRAWYIMHGAHLRSKMHSLNRMTTNHQSTAYVAAVYL